MGEANRHYYATRDPFGPRGDFVTAPEISQMFGELVGLWCVDLWRRSGGHSARYVELGPGRGTLAADARRAMGGAGLHTTAELVETSRLLRDRQARALHHDAHWHRDTVSLPDDAALFVVANEFFDALPVRQLIATADGWRELGLVRDGEGFGRVAGDLAEPEAVPAHLRAAPPGTIFEASPSSVAIVRDIASRLIPMGGAALIFDYGHARSAHGETLQAVAAHRYADPWTEPGERDLSAHVDFEALAVAAQSEGVRVLGPVEQGAWLTAMGIGLRTEALARAAPERAQELHLARDRLVSPNQMGRLFKVMALVAPQWPDPPGFE